MDAGLLTAFRFEVKLMRSPDIVAGSQALPGADGSAPGGADLLGTGAFQDCTGLEIEMDVQEYVEGGRNNGTVRRVGRAKFAPLVLKRGMFYGSEHDGQADPRLWQWLQRIVGGERPVPRFDGVIVLMAPDGSVRATWSFDRGLPAKLRGPELNARTGEVAIEEMTIAHEGLRLLSSEAAR
jgi:phage tail-like protein